MLLLQFLQSRYVFISVFVSLVGISIGITSSAIGIKIYVTTAAIKKYKAMNQKNVKKKGKIISLAKSKLNI